MKKTANSKRPKIEDRRDKRLISKLPTKMLIDSRLVNVKELKKLLNSSIKNNIIKKEQYTDKNKYKQNDNINKPYDMIEDMKLNEITIKPNM